MSQPLIAVLMPPNSPTADLAAAALPKEADARFLLAESAAAFDQALLKDVVGLVWVPPANGSELHTLFALLPQCRWVHSLAAGIDAIASFVPTLQSSSSTLTNGRGAFSESLAEYIMAAALHFNKQFARCEQNRVAQKWDRFTMGTLSGKTMGFLGYGDIAKSAAKLAAPFNMRLIALRRQPSKMESEESLIAQTFNSSEDPTPFYEQCDFVVCTLPLTEQTRGYVGAKAFAAMKPSAIFISLGRGAAVDEAALTAALQQRTIAGAALDVFEVEPLPVSSPLWGCDNLLVTAHNADLTEDYFARGWKGESSAWNLCAFSACVFRLLHGKKRLTPKLSAAHRSVA